jgi:tetratricopeptide (TPR) repeat protein
VVIDSAYSTEIEPILRTLNPTVLREHPRLSFAKGRADLLRGDLNSAHALFAQALSNGVDDPRLIARAAWELGCLALREDHTSVAEIALQLGRGGVDKRDQSMADLRHLDALVAERRSRRTDAITSYRDAIAESGGALTLLTRVIALRNFASAIAHDVPDEAAGMCALGLALVDADDLDARVRPALENVLAYALLCSGRIDEALASADAAIAHAQAAGHSLVELYAGFNRSIAVELLGRTQSAYDELGELIPRARNAGLVDVRRWAQIRRVWLAFQREPPERVRARLERDLEDQDKSPYVDSVTTLRALVDVRAGQAPRAIATLAGLVDRYAAEDDWLTAFPLLLWIAYAHDADGERREAAAAVRASLRIGRSRGFRMSPNWWCSDLVRVARRLASPDDARIAAELKEPLSGRAIRARTTVTVLPDGDLEVDGHRLPAERWRSGRTGSHVLRRLMACLAAAHPVGVERDELMDMLWPASDGDRAAQNLYSALNDLRHLVGGRCGISVELAAGRYHLVPSSDTRFDARSSRAV